MPLLCICVLRAVLKQRMFFPLTALVGRLLEQMHYVLPVTLDVRYYVLFRMKSILKSLTDFLKQFLFLKLVFFIISLEERRSETKILPENIVTCIYC
jgi:hypothetical protein